MIDLNYQPKQEKTEEEPLGMVILGVLPFLLAFLFLLEAAL